MEWHMLLHHISGGIKGPPFQPYKGNASPDKQRCNAAGTAD